MEQQIIHIAIGVALILLVFLIGRASKKPRRNITALEIKERAIALISKEYSQPLTDEQFGQKAAEIRWKHQEMAQTFKEFDDASIKKWIYPKQGKNFLEKVQGRISNDDNLKNSVNLLPVMGWVLDYHHIFNL